MKFPLELKTLFLATSVAIPQYLPWAGTTKASTDHKSSSLVGALVDSETPSSHPYQGQTTVQMGRIDPDLTLEEIDKPDPLNSANCGDLRHRRSRIQKILRDWASSEWATGKHQEITRLILTHGYPKQYREEEVILICDSEGTLYAMGALDGFYLDYLVSKPRGPQDLAGKGSGRAVIKRLITMVIKAKEKRISLFTGDAGKGFYKKFGFVDYYEEPRDPLSEYQGSNDSNMELILDEDGQKRILVEFPEFKPIFEELSGSGQKEPDLLR